jgi:hypothetical protein
MPLAQRGAFCTPRGAIRGPTTGSTTGEEIQMRYEFERDGRTVASVLWEGPGQVTVDVADPADRQQFDRFFGEEVAYLDAGVDFGGGMTRAA